MSENFLQIQEEYLKKVWLRPPEELEAVLPARRHGNSFHLDEEFPASVTCLFPTHAAHFMPVDGLADVAEFTARKVIQLVTEA
jgi:hypothetical protein